MNRAPKRWTRSSDAEPDAPAFTLADWYRWKLTTLAKPGWTPSFADFQRELHASG